MEPLVNENMQNAQEDAANKTECMSGGAKEKIGQLKKGLQNAACQVQDLTSQAGKEVSHFATTAGHKISDAGDTVIAGIRKKPIQSAFVALAIGFLGVFLYPRSKYSK